jgi:hypothetical protein
MTKLTLPKIKPAESYLLISAAYALAAKKVFSKKKYRKR